MAGGYG